MRYKITVILVALAGIGMGLLLMAAVVTGQGRNLTAVPRSLVSAVKATFQRNETLQYSQGDLTNIIFLHHSVGNNLIEQGSVRDQFRQAGYSFWDHGYNFQGLRDSGGAYTGYSYSVPRDDTAPEGLANIFTQQVYPVPLNTISGLLQHEVIAFKPCFEPANHITSDAQMEQYKSWYIQMRDVMDSYPDKLFIVVTIPPLNPAETTPEEAARAHTFATWLSSDEYLKGHPNVYSFDLYGYLAEDDPSSSDENMLRETYREGSDSHPNRLANEEIGPIFVDFVIDAIQEYRANYGSPY